MNRERKLLVGYAIFVSVLFTILPIAWWPPKEGSEWILAFPVLALIGMITNTVYFMIKRRMNYKGLQKDADLQFYHFSITTILTIANIGVCKLAWG